MTIYSVQVQNYPGDAKDFICMEDEKEAITQAEQYAEQKRNLIDSMGCENAVFIFKYTNQGGRELFKSLISVNRKC